jgi:LysR family transcriptional regulator, hydrogen peroxide-inducible genes activator
MNLRDLEYVVAVADHGSFSRAADACNVSQPTLSGQIIKLEAEFGVSLFERTGRIVRVNARAAGVVAEARAALAAAANVAAAARASRDPFEGPLRVGIIATVAPYLLPAALPAAVKALPQTPLRFVEDVTDRLMRDMGEGALDAAVIATEPDGARFAASPLYEEPFFLASASARRELRRKTIPVEEIDPGSLLLLAEGHCLRDQALDLCGAQGSRNGADVRAMSLETLRHLAAAGQGVTLAPLLAFAAWRRQSADVEGLRLVGRGDSRLVRLVRRRNTPRGDAIDALAASLRASAGEALAAARAIV